jgi:hypothetical protein
MSKVDWVEMPWVDAPDHVRPEYHSKAFTWMAEVHPEAWTNNCDPMRGRLMYKWPTYIIQRKLNGWRLFVHATPGELVQKDFDSLEDAMGYCDEPE